MAGGGRQTVYGIREAGKQRRSTAVPAPRCHSETPVLHKRVAQGDAQGAVAAQFLPQDMEGLLRAIYKAK